MNSCVHCGKTHEASLRYCPMTGHPLAEGPQVGSELDGKYVIRRHVSEGPITSTFEAENRLIAKRVAISFVHPRLRSNELAAQRFFRDVQAAGGVEHENLLEMLDIGSDASFGPYAVHEYLTGESLAAVLQQRGFLPLERAIDIAAQILAALAVAHKKGVLCKNARPENVMLTSRAGRDDFVKLLDFSLSAEIASGEPGRAQAGMAYVAPEVRQASDRASATSDLYSVGALLYHMLTGGPPDRDPPTRPSAIHPELPRALDGVVLNALAAEPSARWASTQDFREALRGFLKTPLTKPPITSASKRAATGTIITGQLPTSAGSDARAAETETAPSASDATAVPVMTEAPMPSAPLLTPTPGSEAAAAEAEFWSNPDGRVAQGRSSFERTGEWDLPAGNVRKLPLVLITLGITAVLVLGLGWMIAGRGTVRDANSEWKPPPLTKVAPAAAPAVAPTPAASPAVRPAPTAAPAQAAPTPTAAPRPIAATTLVAPKPMAAPAPAPVAPKPMAAPAPAPVAPKPIAAPAPAPVAPKPVVSAPAAPAKVVVPPHTPKVATEPTATQPPKPAPKAPRPAKAKREIITDNPY